MGSIPHGQVFFILSWNDTLLWSEVLGSSRDVRSEVLSDWPIDEIAVFWLANWLDLASGTWLARRNTEVETPEWSHADPRRSLWIIRWPHVTFIFVKKKNNFE